MDKFDNTTVPDYMARAGCEGKCFLVIGAGQGIGRQVTHALAAAGAKLICVDINEDLAKNVANEVAGTAWVGDCTSRADVERLRDDSLELLGRVDGFVDIVGIAAWADLLSVDDETWQQQLDICLRHAYLLCQLLAPPMIANGGGTMLFIGSASGITSAPNHAAYGAAKAGLMSLMRSIAVELGPQGIRANSIAPGVVGTPRVLSFTSKEQQQMNAENAPLGRIGKPEDIAGAALFFMSNLSGYVSGQTLQVDGGVSAKFPYPVLGS